MASIIEFPRNNYNNQSDVTTSLNNNNYNNNNSDSVIDRENDLVQIAAAYTLYFGYRMPYAIERQCENLLTQTACTASLIVAVIEYTTITAPRPAWPYARAVINRQLAAGVTDAAGFAAACQAYTDRQQLQPSPARCGGVKRVIEQQYSQREYDPGEYDGPSAEDIAEAAALDAARSTQAAR